MALFKGIFKDPYVINRPQFISCFYRPLYWYDPSKPQLNSHSHFLINLSVNNFEGMISTGAIFWKLPTLNSIPFMFLETALLSVFLLFISHTFEFSSFLMLSMALDQTHLEKEMSRDTGILETEYKMANMQMACW